MATFLMKNSYLLEELERMVEEETERKISKRPNSTRTDDFYKITVDELIQYLEENVFGQDPYSHF